MSIKMRNQIQLAIGSIAVLILLVAIMPAQAVRAANAPPLKIAVFDFELEDVSAAGALSPGETAGDLARMQAVSIEARRVLAQSGRYTLIDTNGVDAEPVKERSLRNCDGCDAGIALKLGAERSFIGVVTRVAKTEYYVSLLMTDTSTGKVVSQQTAFFTGADDAWASGVRMLIMHGVLADPNS
ncbi:MAG TPA: DUF3280 domain-containing protein [Steroidobacteraceae bacterium]|jgi:hypothetical protein|nr:DUF3280 domain-containing protein [Steroidobacteraceae bacterium]